MRGILVADPEPGMVRLLKDYLELRRFCIHTAESCDELLSKLPVARPGIVLLAPQLSPDDGIGLVHRIRQHSSRTGVLVMADAGDVETGRVALKMGAFDCVLKPLDLAYLEKAIWWQMKLLSLTG